MQITTWIGLALIWWVIIYRQHLKKKFLRNRQKNRSTEGVKMEEMIKSFMNKPVVLSLIEDGFDNEGEIISYSDGWIIFKTKKGEEHAINCDYIIKIREKEQKKQK